MESKSAPKKANGARRQARRRRTQPRQGAKLDNQRSGWANVYSDVPLFPVSVRKTLRYYDFDQTITASLGVAAARFFSANGLFDPDVSGTGHQPMGFDQMMLMYEQATVLSSKCTVNFIVGATPGRVGIYLNPDTVSITDPVRLVENGLLVSQSLDSATVSGTGGTGERRCELTRSCDVPKYFGRPNDRTFLNDTDMQSTAAANPTEQVYFGVVCWNCFQAANGVTIEYDVLLEYDVVFWEPRKLTIS